MEGRGRPKRRGIRRSFSRDPRADKALTISLPTVVRLVLSAPRGMSKGMLRFRFWYPRRRLLIFALLVALLPGCGVLTHLQQKRRVAALKKSAGPQLRWTQLIGTIALVNTEGKYVLIDSGSRPSPAVGTTLQNRPEGSPPAELHVTEIRKRPFVIADIVSGIPQEGDDVYQ